MWLVLWMPNISVCETFSPIHKFEVEKMKCVAFFVLEAFDFDKGDRFDGQWRPLRAQMDLEKTKGLVYLTSSPCNRHGVCPPTLLDKQPNIFLVSPHMSKTCFHQFFPQN